MTSALYFFLFLPSLFLFLFLFLVNKKFMQNLHNSAKEGVDTYDVLNLPTVPAQECRGVALRRLRGPGSATSAICGEHRPSSRGRGKTDQKTTFASAAHVRSASQSVWCPFHLIAFGMVVVGWLGRGTTTLHCPHYALAHRLKVLSPFLFCVSLSSALKVLPL